MGALDGKTIIVTGASRGLGEAMALGFARESAALVLSARTIEDLESVGLRCKEAGASAVTVIPADVTDEAQVASLCERTVVEHGSIDVFVANAGTSYHMLTDKRYGEITTYDREIVDRLYEVNVVGTWLCMKAALPLMREGSSFIVIGSETGRVLRPGSGFYALSKAAQEALSTMASRENAARSVRVNVLSPGGMVDTQLFGPNGMSEQLKQHVPPLPAEIIVDPAIWLASDQSAGITGAFLSGRDFATRGAEAIGAELRAASPA